MHGSRRESTVWTRHETRDQRDWSASFCLLIALIYFLPPVDSKGSCLGPFRELVCARNKGRDKGRERQEREKKRGGGRELKEIKLSECMTHQLIAEILFLSKEKTGLKHPIKERMKGNLLLQIHRRSSFEVLHSNKIFNILTIIF